MSAPDTGRTEVTAELWDWAAGVLTAVSIGLLLAFLAVMLAAYATGNPAVEVAAVVLASWALLALLATHAADTQCQALPWRLITWLRPGGGR